MNRIKLLLVTLFLILAGASQAHVELIYPQGGETFTPGEVVTIEWNILIQHNTLNWDLYYSMDAGESWNPIEEDIPYENLTYDWIVPGDSTNKARIRIVQDNVGTDYSDQSENFTIAPTTGIGEGTMSSVQIYPNPVITFFHVQAENDIERIGIYDASGRLVFDSQPFSRRTEINLTGLPENLYLVTVKTSEAIIREKLIKQ